MQINEIFYKIQFAFFFNHLYILLHKKITNYYNDDKVDKYLDCRYEYIFIWKPTKCTSNNLSK